MGRVIEVNQYPRKHRETSDTQPGKYVARRRFGRADQIQTPVFAGNRRCAARMPQPHQNCVPAPPAVHPEAFTRNVHAAADLPRASKRIYKKKNGTEGAGSEFVAAMSKPVL